MTPPLRLVMDTSILISAMRSQLGASYRLLQLAMQHRVKLFASTSLVLEYQSVLERPEHTSALGRSVQQNLAALDDLLLHIEAIEVITSIRPALRDPNDDHVLEAAVNGKIDAIVTHNVRDFLPESLLYGIRIERPGAIIRLEANR